MAARPPLWDVSPPPRRGGACPSRRFSEFFSVNAGVSPFEAARRVAAPYGCHCPWKTGGHIGPPLRRFRQITAESDNGRGLPLPPVFGISSVNAGGSSCGAARRVAAPYGCHCPWKTGGHRGPPLRHFRSITAESDKGRSKITKRTKPRTVGTPSFSILIVSVCAPSSPARTPAGRPAPPWTWGG